MDFKKYPFNDYLKKLKTFKYVISPEGNSVDCHRIWESIYLGVIPIVKRHIALESFEDLPILFINNWDEIEPYMLTDIYFNTIKKEKNKSDFDYYRNLINE